MIVTRIAITTVLVSLFIHYYFGYSYTAEIVLEQGILRGVALNGYNAYFGIPYATVPRRFDEPGPAPSWSDVFYATNGNIQCNQVLPIVKIAVGQEDCLVANIYTPDTNKRGLPVMVFIHGGGFQFGSNTNFLYDAKYLAQKSIIVVSINYRLGVFGFLCLHKKRASGNMAFKDQIAALQWVQQNIDKFGGDPKEVTIVGESAGATSVQYLSLSPLAKGFFKRVILQSGSILVPIGFVTNPVDKGILVASNLGYNTTDEDEILDILLNADATKLTKASFMEMKNNIVNSFIFQPCAEDIKVSKNPFLLTNPRQLLKEAKMNTDISIIIGFNDKEGIMFAGQYDTNGLKRVYEDLTTVLPRNLVFKSDDDKIRFLDDIRKMYFDETEATYSYSGLIDYFTDCLIVYPSMEVIEYYIKGNATVFNYLFQYDSFRNLNKFVSGLPFTPGANHADELFYIFDPILFKLLPRMDKEMVEFMTTAWTNFVKTGLPGPHWQDSKKDGTTFLSIENDGIRMTKAPIKKRMQFWKDAYKKYAAY